MRNKLTRRKVSSVKRIVSQKDCATKLFSSRNCFPLSASSGGWNCAMQFTNIRIREEIRMANSEYSTLVGKRFDTEQNKNFFSMQPKSNLWVTSGNDLSSGSKIKKKWENCFQNILYYLTSPGGLKVPVLGNWFEAYENLRDKNLSAAFTAV